ncbi:MAG: hypothetical protein ABWX96_05985, partial [Propionibacteriaceae bacterium]
SAAALDVLTAAQDQARQHLQATRQLPDDVAMRVDQAAREVDELVARFHAGLHQVKASVLADDNGASLARDGSGGHSLRSYEYGLLLNAQQTADRVTNLARHEAERILTNADDEVRVLEQRIAELRRVEAELAASVASQLQERRL